MCFSLVGAHLRAMHSAWRHSRVPNLWHPCPTSLASALPSPHQLQPLESFGWPALCSKHARCRRTHVHSCRASFKPAQAG